MCLELGSSVGLTNALFREVEEIDGLDVLLDRELEHLSRIDLEEAAETYRCVELEVRVIGLAHEEREVEEGAEIFVGELAVVERRQLRVHVFEVESLVFEAVGGRLRNWVLGLVHALTNVHVHDSDLVGVAAEHRLVGSEGPRRLHTSRLVLALLHDAVHLFGEGVTGLVMDGGDSALLLFW